MSTKKRIAVFGSSSGALGEPMYDAMVEVGRLLARRNCVVINGGFGGIMEAVSKGAREADGVVVGNTMLGRPGNEYLTETVDCKRLAAAIGNVPEEVQFGVRLGLLLSSDAFIVAGGGGPGTMAELMAVAAFNARFWVKPKPLAILNPSKHPTGWDVLMLGRLMSIGVLPRVADEVSAWLQVASSPEGAVEWVLQV